MFQWYRKTIYCQGSASLGDHTAITQNGAGVPLAAYRAILSQGPKIMLTCKKLAQGTATRSRTALAFFAATLLVGGSVTESSARSRHHHHHHHHDASNSPSGSLGGSW